MLNLVYKTDSETRAVRIIMRDGEPWFVLADICEVLGIQNPSDVVKRLEDDGQGLIEIIDSMNRIQKVRGVNESGVYEVILGSRRNPKTKSFKLWITREVLPTIRKTGSYSINSVPQLSTSPAQVALQMAQALVDIEARAERVEARTNSLEQTLAQHVARQTINHAQKKTIHTLVGKLARETGYSRAWRILKDEFVLAAYGDMPASRFLDAVKFLELQIVAYSGSQERLVSA